MEPPHHHEGVLRALCVRGERHHKPQGQGGARQGLEGNRKLPGRGCGIECWTDCGGPQLRASRQLRAASCFVSRICNHLPYLMRSQARALEGMRKAVRLSVSLTAGIWHRALPNRVRQDSRTAPHAQFLHTKNQSGCVCPVKRNSLGCAQTHAVTDATPACISRV